MTTDRELTIDQRRAVIAAGVIGHDNLAADLVEYGSGQSGLHLAVAKLVWPVAFQHFDALHHGRAVDNFHLPEVQAVYKLARGGDSTAKEVWPAAELAKRQGMGWGHYPIVKGGEHAKGSQITWKVKAGDSVALRTTLPTTPEHRAICRICNQILAEAESTTLRVLTMTSNEAHKAKARWKKRPSVRWFPIPQHMGKVVMIHGEEKEGGEELGAMCDGYGKAQLFALVEGWMGNKPEGARARGVSGWGKRYKLAKGHNEESLAHAEEQQAAVASGKSGATFSVTSLASPFTVSNVFNSTVDGGGNGLDVTTSVKAEVDTLLQFGHIQPLKPKAYANLERVEGILKANQNEGEGDKFPFKGHIINTNTMSLKRENEETGETSPLSALPPKQRNKPPKERPLAEAVADSIARAWAEAAAEMGAAVAYEVQPC